MKIDAIYMKKIYFHGMIQNYYQIKRVKKKENTGTNDTYE